MRVVRRAKPLIPAEEEVEGRNHVALITEAFWETHFQRDPKILGRRLPEFCPLPPRDGCMAPLWCYAILSLADKLV
jgi:hypothetical protein